MSDRKRILITGAGGFLGRNLLSLMRNDNRFDVIALSSSIKDYEATNITVVDSDAGLNISWENVEAVLNCAFPRTEESTVMPSGMLYIKNILQKAAEEGVESVINISSQSVYSQKRENAADEDSPIVLESKYAVAKYASELMANSLCKQQRHTNIRLASLIGPGFNQRLINKFVEQAIKGNDINAIDSGQIYGFMDVVDAADGIKSILLDEGPLDEIYNLGIHGGYSIVELAEWAVKQCNNGCKVNITEGNAYTNSMINCERFYRRFEWKPKISIKESVEKIAHDYSI